MKKADNIQYFLRVRKGRATTRGRNQDQSDYQQRRHLVNAVFHRISRRVYPKIDRKAFDAYLPILCWSFRGCLIVEAFMLSIISETSFTLLDTNSCLSLLFVVSAHFNRRNSFSSWLAIKCQLKSGAFQRLPLSTKSSFSPGGNLDPANKKLQEKSVQTSLGGSSLHLARLYVGWAF